MRSAVEAVTVELPIVDDAEADEIEAARQEARERERHRTPPDGTRIRLPTLPGGVPNGVPGGVCTDPSYVAYLEYQVQLSKNEAESARSVVTAVGAHNADLTLQVETLSRELETLRADKEALMNRLIATQWELLEAENSRRR